MFGRNLPVRRTDDMFSPILSDFDRFMDEWPTGALWPSVQEPMEQLFLPAIDLREDDKSVEVKCELPGLTHKDINISVERNVLRISGEKKSEWENKEKGMFRRESRYGSFSRSIRLPDGVDEDNIDAVFKNGILTVNIPKSADYEKKHRRVEIKTDNKH